MRGEVSLAIPGTLTTSNRQSSVIVKVRGPLVRRDRSHIAALPRALESPEAGCGDCHAGPNPPVFVAMSRRGVRRFNVGTARAHSALRPYHAASLLP